ncbi:uncharacterized protein LOC119282311 [Triticum dicoccoides]|uniref:uncharacterized protein LOC119282311 n=1 Tax=Triticum dicoccoides TaxID=85692 RepID=UPI00188DDA97|nr:uncharacterized protein LOC119282311 [Triticum dicoccoides]
MLFIKPWLRQAHAKSRLMRVQVDLMIEGVSSHAWARSTAEELLGSSCLIESLAPETESRDDLSLFKLRAWCVDPEVIPACHRLWVPEPPMLGGNQEGCCPSLRQLLEYPILIHIGRLRDFSPPELWRRSPSSDSGSGQSGLPDSSPASQGGEWLVLNWTRGVCDYRGSGRNSPGQGGGGGVGRTYRQALEGRVGPSNWRIPPMSRPGPAVVVVASGVHEVHRESAPTEGVAEFSNLHPVAGLATAGMQGVQNQSGGVADTVTVPDKVVVADTVVGCIETALGPETARPTGLSKDQVGQNPEENLTASISVPDAVPIAAPRDAAVVGQPLELLPWGGSDPLRLVDPVHSSPLLGVAATPAQSIRLAVADPLSRSAGWDPVAEMLANTVMQKWRLARWWHLHQPRLRCHWTPRKLHASRLR